MAYEATTVPVEKSQGAVRALLTKAGADRLAFGEERIDGTPWAVVAFAVGGRAVRIRVPHKPVDRTVIARKIQRARSKTSADIRAELEEQEARRIWRVMAWNLKARMESVEEGVETFEEAFLAHLLDERTGRTIYEQLAEDGRVELAAPLPQLTAGSGS